MIPAWLASLIARSTPSAATLPGLAFHDRRKTAARSHDHGKRKPPTGICLHQTACLLGERPERWDTVGAHIGITRGGQVIWLHDFDRLVWHGNGWNQGTIGIEIDGLYAGIEGDETTVWNDPRTTHREQGMTLTPEAAQAARDTARWIRETVPSVNVIVAHRQSSATRRSDPGQAIWQQVALQSGLKTANWTTLGDGLKVPREWDPASTAKY